MTTAAEYEDKVVEEQKKGMELEEHVRAMQKMVSKQRKDMGGWVVNFLYVRACVRARVHTHTHIHYLLIVVLLL